MWQQMYHWMRITQYQHPLDQRRAATLLVILIAGACLPVSTIGGTLLSDLSVDIKTLIIGAVTIGFVISCGALLALRLGRIRLTAWVVIMTSVVITTIVYVAVGSQHGGVVLYFYALPILCAAVGGTRQIVWTSAASSIGGVAVALLLEQVTHVPAARLTHSEVIITLSLFVSTTAILTTIVVHFSASYQLALALSVQREADLETLRVSLASQIDERTRELRQALQEVENREETLAHALANLRESEVRQRAMLEAIPDAMYRVNRAGV